MSQEDSDSPGCGCLMLFLLGGSFIACFVAACAGGGGGNPLVAAFVLWALGWLVLGVTWQVVKLLAGKGDPAIVSATRSGCGCLILLAALITLPFVASALGLTLIQGLVVGFALFALAWLIGKKS